MRMINGLNLGIRRTWSGAAGEGQGAGPEAQLLRRRQTTDGAEGEATARGDEAPRLRVAHKVNNPFFLEMTPVHGSILFLELDPDQDCLMRWTFF